MDKHHGQGGSFEVDKASGERKPVSKPQERHAEGDRARDKDGKPLSSAADQVEAALPAPQPAPWLEKEKPAEPVSKAVTKKAS